MGQIGDKCNCFGDKNDKTTVHLEDGNQPSIKNIFTPDDFFNVKSGGVNINNSSLNKDLRYPQFNEKTFYYLVRLQSLVRGYLYRVLYKEIKKTQIQETYNLLEKYTNTFRTTNLFKAESYKVSSFDPVGWKKFYQSDANENYIFNYNYGRVFPCKLIINSDGLSIYSGHVNIKNQKHGFGVLLTKDGQKYEGAWIYNKFTCWGRYIDIEGNIYNGKFIIQESSKMGS